MSAKLVFTHCDSDALLRRATVDAGESAAMIDSSLTSLL